jgi:hypothetical protein
MSSTALKNFTAFGFGLPSGRSLPAVTRTATSSVVQFSSFATWTASKSDFFRRDGERVAKTNVHLQRHNGVADAGSQLHPDAGIASHYLKLLLDAIFGGQNFRNEIIWERTTGRKSVSRFGPVRDIILFYLKNSKATWNEIALPQSEENAKVTI